MLEVDDQRPAVGADEAVDDVVVVEAKSLLANGREVVQVDHVAEDVRSHILVGGPAEDALAGEHHDVAGGQAGGERVAHRREGDPLALEGPDGVVDADDAVVVGEALGREAAEHQRAAALPERLQRGRGCRPAASGCAGVAETRAIFFVGVANARPADRPPWCIAGRWRRRPWPTAVRRSRRPRRRTPACSPAPQRIRLSSRCSRDRVHAELARRGRAGSDTSRPCRPAPRPAPSTRAAGRTARGSCRRAWASRKRCGRRRWSGPQVKKSLSLSPRNAGCEASSMNAVRPSAVGTSVAEVVLLRARRQFHLGGDGLVLQRVGLIEHDRRRGLRRPGRPAGSTCCRSASMASRPTTSTLASAGSSSSDWTAVNGSPGSSETPRVSPAGSKTATAAGRAARRRRPAGPRPPWCRDRFPCRPTLSARRQRRLPAARRRRAGRSLRRTSRPCPARPCAWTSSRRPPCRPPSAGA